MSSTSTHMFAPFVLVLLAFASFNSQADAAEQGPDQATQGVKSSQELRSVLVAELAGALGAGHRVTDDRISKIENAMGPMFASLPKNEHSNLDQDGVRYVLHRLFTYRHGLFLKGLDPVDQKFNTSASGVLESQVPAHVMGIIEERVGGRGLGIHEIAVLAATLEHLIHDEAIDRLKSAYAAVGLSIDVKPTEMQVIEVIDVYMILLVKDGNLSSMTREEVTRRVAQVHRRNTNWNATLGFALGVRKDVINTASMIDTLSFDSTARVVEEIGERYGRWQDSECRDLKATLVALGDQGVGRVLLKDFFRGALSGHWQFSESVEYLRELGALDETDPAAVSVIVPNYMNSPTNCVATGSMFSVCCIDECETILGKIEREISAPDADPQRIIEIVSNLPSASVEVPRILPSLLVGRLDDVARHHNGRVPLHARLFSQWLHHAYPRECPYPQVTGTVRPQTAEEMKQQGKAVRASRYEQRQYALSTSAESRSSSRPKAKKSEQERLQWEQDEEFFVAGWSPSVEQKGDLFVEQLSSSEFLDEESSPSGPAPARSSWAECCRGFVCLAVLLAMALGFKDTIMSALSGSNRFGAKMSREYLPHSHSV